MNRLRWLALPLLLAVATPSWAQIRLGARIIPQFTGFLNSDDADSKIISPQTTTSAAAGLSIGYRFAKRFGVEMNILYAPVSQQYLLRSTENLRSTFPDGFLNYTIDVTYIKVPIFLTYNSVKKKAIFRAAIGPQISFQSGVRETVEGFDVSYTGFGMSAADKFKGIVIGVAAGVGIDFSISKALVLNTGIRADLGFTDAENKSAQWRDPFAGGVQVNYYDNYRFPVQTDRPRTSITRQYSVGFMVGITYLMSNKGDEGGYRW